MLQAAAKLSMSILILHSSLVWAGPRAQARQIASVSPNSPEITAVQKLAAEFSEKKYKVSEFLKKLEGKIPTEYMDLLKKKSKSERNESFEFEILGPTKFVLRAEGNETIFEVINLDEGQFKVNNRLTTLDFSQKPEQLWKDMETLFPKTKGARHPFLMLFLPEAQAFWEWIALIGAVGVGLYMYNKSTCDKYRNYADQCNFVVSNPDSNVGVPELYANIKSLQDKWFNLSLGCSSQKADVATCATYLQNRLSGTANDTPGMIKGYQAPAPAARD